MEDQGRGVVRTILTSLGQIGNEPATQEPGREPVNLPRGSPGPNRAIHRPALRGSSYGVSVPAAEGEPSYRVDDGDGGGHALRVRHREVDVAGVELLRELGHLPGERHARLRPSADLDVAPHELHPAADRLAHRLLAGEARGEVLRRVR